MARTIKTDLLECRAPTVAQARRLWEAVTGDGNTSIDAKRIVIEATGQAKARSDEGTKARRI